MKCISVREPWAHLLVHGFKPHEFRTWVTDHRGPLAIQSSKTYARKERLITSHYLAEEVIEMRDLFEIEATLGTIRGVVELVDIVDVMNLFREKRALGLSYEQLTILNAIRRSYGYPGDEEAENDPLYAWKVEPRKIFKEPAPFKGQLNVFDVPDDLLDGPCVEV